MQLNIEVDADELNVITKKEDKLSPRDELLGLKQRNISKTNSDDLDQLIGFHQQKQDKIVEDMLTLTRSLKEQSQLANKIIKKDTEV